MQAGDAALLFSPDNTRQIAETVQKLWNDAELRQTLILRGRRRVAEYTWDRTARAFRAHYRRIAARQLTDEDQAILTAPATM